MVGTHAGDMIGEIALAIEMGADAVDIGKTIHPHPTLGESIGMAAEVAHGSCTDFAAFKENKLEMVHKKPPYGSFFMRKMAVSSARVRPEAFLIEPCVRH
jgi:hypothetical protein